MAVPCKEFSPGKLVATPGVLARIDREVLLASYVRHLCCDWGICPSRIGGKTTAP